jgi:membrane protease YdiL (CAAX protease family)
MRPATPSLLHSFLLLMIFVGLQTGLSVPVMLLLNLGGTGTGINAGWLAVLNSGAFVGAALLAQALTRHPWPSLLTWRPGRGNLLPGVTMLALGTAVMVAEVANLTLFALPMPEFVSRMMTETLSLEENPILGTLALVIVAPVTEEFVCRRWLLASMLQRWSPARSITLSAVAFGAMHMNPWQFFYATVLGFSLGWLYWRTRSTALCIAWHAIHNSLSVLFTFWKPDIPGLRGGFGDPVEFNPWWLNLAGVILIGLAGIWIVRRTDPREPDNAPGDNGPPPLPPSLPAA